MCDLCDPELRDKARKAMLYRVADIEKLASKLRCMAYGEIKPHGEEAKVVGILARHVIRELVQEWV